MPAHITAYVYVMAMAMVVFALLQRPMTKSLMSPEDFALRRNIWIGVTSAAFLGHNYWVFVIVAAVIVLVAAQRERNRPALFFLLLLAVPNFESDVPGFGVVNFLFRMSPARLLSLVILVPLAIRLVQEKHPSSSIQKVSQAFVVAFVALMVVVLAFTDNPINTLANNVRNLIDVMLLIVVPFYVMTHAIRDLRQLRETLACAVLGLSLLGLFALFETMRHWLIFESLRGPLGLPPPRLTLYVIRETEGGGALRAMTTAGHPIVLGYFMGVAVCLWVALRKSLQPSLLGLAALGAPAVGLLVALSRGPWIGTAAGLLVLVLAGPNAGKRIVVTASVLAASFMGLMATPYGDKVLGYIPFVGTVEKGTVDYRVKLIEVSMQIFWDNPILGNYDAIIDPRLEEMRQGQGIVDMVNTYLGTALQYGTVGVVLFVAPFMIAMLAGIVQARAVEREHPVLGLTGRALVGVMVATLVTIATTSSVEYMPIFYWPLVGCATAYLGIAIRWRTAQRSAALRPLVARAGAGGAPLLRPAAAAATRAPTTRATAIPATTDAAASDPSLGGGTEGSTPRRSSHRTYPNRRT